MFELAPIEWLQGFASPFLDGLMAGISELGYTAVYAAIVLFLAFAVRLRPALGLLLAMILAGIVIEGLKVGIGFPRPEHVIQLQASSPHPEALDAAGFWSLPSAEARAAVQAMPDITHGFPSGHVTAAMTFCLGMALFFRWRLVWGLVAVWPVLMALSRMYLARHYLADVLGGWVLGIAMAMGAVGTLRWLHPPDGAKEAPPPPRRMALVCGVSLALAAGSLWTPLLDAANVGRLVAWAGVYAWLSLRGFPVEVGGFWSRAGRFLAAVLLYGGLSWVVKWGLAPASWQAPRLADLVATVVILGGTLVGAVAIGRRLGWYRVP